MWGRDVGLHLLVYGDARYPIDVIKVRQQLFGMKDGFGVVLRGLLTSAPVHFLM